MSTSRPITPNDDLIQKQNRFHLSVNLDAVKIPYSPPILLQDSNKDVNISNTSINKKRPSTVENPTSHSFSTKMSTSKRLNFLNMLSTKKKATEPANPQHHQIYLEFKRRQREDTLKKIQEKRALKKHERDYGVMVIHHQNFQDYFDFYGNVRYIYLPRSQIRSVESLQFLFLCPLLRKLDLSGNNIVYLPKEELWEKLQSLEVLYLHKNKIASLNTIKRLSVLKNLVYLTVFGNPIVYIEDFCRTRILRIIPHLKALDHHVTTIMDMMAEERDFSEFNYYVPCGEMMKLPFTPMSIPSEYVDYWSEYERRYDPTVPIDSEVSQVKMLNTTCDPITRIKSVWKGYSLRKMIITNNPKLLAKNKSAGAAAALLMLKDPIAKKTLSGQNEKGGTRRHNDRMKTKRLGKEDTKKKTVKWNLSNESDPFGGLVSSYQYSDTTEDVNRSNEMLEKFRAESSVSKIVMLQRQVRRKLAARYTMQSYIEKNLLNKCYMHLSDIQKLYQMYLNNGISNFYEQFRVTKTPAYFLNYEQKDHYNEVRKSYFPFVLKSGAVLRFMNFKALVHLGQLPKEKYHIRCRELLTVNELNAIYKRMREPCLEIHRNLDENQLWKLQSKDYRSLAILISRVQNHNYNENPQNKILMYFESDVTKITCAVTIQSCWRSYRMRQWLKIKRIRRRAAILIQLLWKKRIAKKKLHFLKTIKGVIDIQWERKAYLSIETWKRLDSFQLPAIDPDLYYEQSHIDFFCQRSSMFESEIKAIEIAPPKVIDGNMYTVTTNHRLRSFIRKELGVPPHMYEPPKKPTSITMLLAVGATVYLHTSVKRRAKLQSTADLAPFKDGYIELKYEYDGDAHKQAVMLALKTYTRERNNSSFVSFASLEDCRKHVAAMQISSWWSKILKSRREKNDILEKDKKDPVNTSVINSAFDSISEIKQELDYLENISTSRSLGKAGMKTLELAGSVSNSIANYDDLGAYSYRSTSSLKYDLPSARREKALIEYEGSIEGKLTRPHVSDRKKQTLKDIQNEEELEIIPTPKISKEEVKGKRKKYESLEETLKFREEMNTLRREKLRRELEDIEEKKRKVQSARQTRAKVIVEKERAKSSGVTPRKLIHVHSVDSNLRETIEKLKANAESGDDEPSEISTILNNLSSVDLVLEKSSQLKIEDEVKQNQDSHDKIEEYLEELDSFKVEAKAVPTTQILGYPFTERLRPEVYLADKMSRQYLSHVAKVRTANSNKHKVEKVKKEKRIGHEKIMNWDYQKQLEIERMKYKKEQNLIELDELKQREAEEYQVMRDRIQEMKKDSQFKKMQKELIKGFTCKSNLITKQIRAREIERKKEEWQMKVADVVRERKDLNTTRKDNLNTLLLQDLNRKRATVTYGNQKMKKMIEEKKREKYLQSRLKHNRVKLEKSLTFKDGELFNFSKDDIMDETIDLEEDFDDQGIPSPIRVQHSLKELSEMSDDELMRTVASSHPVTPSSEEKEELRKLKAVFKRRTPPSKRVFKGSLQGINFPSVVDKSKHVQIVGVNYSD